MGIQMQLNYDRRVYYPFSIENKGYYKMPTTWTIAIDWDRNGNYTGTDDNITSYVMQANWFIGSRKPYMDMADNTLCTLIIKNDDK